MPQYHKLADEQLMRLLHKGDEAAFNLLYQRYGKKLYAYFWRALNREEALAEDFTQQLFLKLIEHGKSYDSQRPFSTWLYSIAANMVKNEYRRIARQENNKQRQIKPATAVYPDGWRQLDAEFWRQQLDKALTQLSEKHRQVFLLRFQEERSIQEISVIMNCPEGTVKSRLFYAIGYLSQQLEKIRHA